MKFIVTYRDAQGKSAEMNVEASSREQCLDTLRKKNIVSIHIRQTSYRKEYLPKFKSFRNKSIILFILSASLISLICLIFFMSKKEMEMNPVLPPKTNIQPKSPVYQTKEADKYAVDSFTGREKKAMAHIENTPHPNYGNPDSGEQLPEEKKQGQTVEGIKRPLFKHFSERQIAGLLKVDPGDTLIGTMNYGQAFLRDFKNSLTNKIVIFETDEPDVQELKKIVAQTKQDLFERMEKGEDICQIMSDTRKDLQQMGLYRRELQTEFQNLYHDQTISDQEVDEFIRQANDLLEKKGLKPIKLPHIFLRKLKN